MGYDNLGATSPARQNNPLNFEHTITAGLDKSQTAYSSASTWSDISASLTHDSVSYLRKNSTALPATLDFDQPLNQRKDPVSIKRSAHDDPNDPRPYWLISEQEGCADQREIEKAAHLPPGSFGTFTSCHWMPEDLHKIAVPVDKDGDPLFGTSSAAAELPKVSEAMRKALGNPEKNSLKFFDLIAEERLLLPGKQFSQLMDGLNEKLAEWNPERKLLADGTYVRGNANMGTSYFLEANGSFRQKGWGPRPEDNWEKTRTAEDNGIGYEERYKTSDPKGVGYAIRLRSDYSYTLLRSDGSGQSRDADGNTSTRRNSNGR